MTLDASRPRQPVHTESVVWPKSPLGVQSARLAARLNSLDGARVGFLWDDLFRGDELFPVLERELTQRHPGLEVIAYERFGSTHGSDEAGFVAALPTILGDERVDAVVSGMGC